MLKNKNKKVLLVFLIFFILLLFQHHFMWLYHDDYGYAALSYIGDVYKINNLGFHTTQSDIIKFLILHYNNWGGRILYFFFECNILHLGIHGFRLFQSIIFTLIFYYIYKILSFIFKKEDYKLAIIVTSLYGVFEAISYKDGIFWFSASILYIVPLLPFLMFLYRYILKDKNKTIKDIIIGSILVFLAAFSQEQISAMVLGFVIIYELDKLIKNKKFEMKESPIILSSLIGFLILLLCPGNKIRMSGNNDFSNLSIIGKLKVSIPNIIFNNFGIETRIFTIMFFAAIAFIAYENIKNKKLKKLNIVSLISVLLILFMSTIKSEGYFMHLLYLNDNLIYKGIVFTIIMIQLLLIIYSVLLYYYNKKQINLIEIFISIFGTQAVMLVAPNYSLRSTLMFEFMMFIFIAYVIYENIKKNKFILYIPILIILIFNYSCVTYGYIMNDSINAYNHKILLETGNKIKNDEDIKSVTLKKLKNDLYASTLPYEEGHEYIYRYMRPYYNLPDDFVIEYK